MTVKELITELLNYPMEAHVYRNDYGNLHELHERDLTLDKENDLIIE